MRDKIDTIHTTEIKTEVMTEGMSKPQEEDPKRDEEDQFKSMNYDQIQSILN